MPLSNHTWGQATEGSARRPQKGPHALGLVDGVSLATSCAPDLTTPLVEQEQTLKQHTPIEHMHATIRARWGENSRERELDCSTPQLLLSTSNTPTQCRDRLRPSHTPIAAPL